MKRLEGKTAKSIWYQQSSTETSRVPLVLVMGYAGSSRTWPQPFIEKLAKSYHVVTLDNLGTGLSPKPKSPQDYSIAGMARDVNDVATALALPPFHLLGYSLGGCVALEYAHVFGDRLKSLVLMATTAGGASYTRPPQEMLAALAVPQGDTLWDLYMSTWRLCMSEAAIALHAATLTQIFEESKTSLTPRNGLKGHMHAYRTFDGNAYLAHLTPPTLVITGAKDRLTPPRNSEWLAANIPTSKLVTIADCEHAPHIETEVRLLSEITQFCR